jgi:hypothetical protein
MNQRPKHEVLMPPDVLQDVAEREGIDVSDTYEQLFERLDGSRKTLELINPALFQVHARGWAVWGLKRHNPSWTHDRIAKALGWGHRARSVEAWTALVRACPELSKTVCWDTRGGAR